MKKVLVAVGLSGVAIAARADVLQTKGQLVFNSSGAEITECGSGQVLRLGVMASNPYFHLMKRFKEVSAGGRQAVLVEVRGTLAADSNGNQVLGSPTIISVVAGSCSRG